MKAQMTVLVFAIFLVALGAVMMMDLPIFQGSWIRATKKDW